MKHSAQFHLTWKASLVSELRSNNQCSWFIILPPHWEPKGHIQIILKKKEKPGKSGCLSHGYLRALKANPCCRAPKSDIYTLFLVPWRTWNSFIPQSMDKMYSAGSTKPEQLLLGGLRPSKGNACSMVLLSHPPSATNGNTSQMMIYSQEAVFSWESWVIWKQRLQALIVRKAREGLWGYEKKIFGLIWAVVTITCFNACLHHTSWDYRCVPPHLLQKTHKKI